MTLTLPATHVQFGCGFSCADGWLNFDASPTLRFERIPLVGNLYKKNQNRFPEDVMYGDIVKGLPVPPESVVGLYASHILEHLSLDDFTVALRNSFKILRRNGVFRLIVPDLRARAELYVSRWHDPNAAHDFMETTYLGKRARPRTLKSKIIDALGNSQHLWMWDEASMSRALTNAGFIDIRRCAFGDADDPMFARVEEAGRFRDGEIEELAIECRRP